MSQFVVCALYKFVRLDDFAELRDPLQKLLLTHNIKGTILLAQEGLNGTVAGRPEAINSLLDWFKCDSRLADIEVKISEHINSPFHRSKVKLKKEIVTLEVENIDPTNLVGTRVDAKDWNALISDPKMTVIDTRNDYEIQIGQFKKAINPATTNFREFPHFVKKSLDPEKHKKIAMYCTGGIRCEKSTAYLIQQGFEQVYHLHGGILKYLEQVPEQESLWQGECFVFDERVAVNHQLQKGQYDQCNACRRPITNEHKLSPKYEQGVTCPYCYDTASPQQKARFLEREKQVKLARKRGEQHIGSDVSKTNLNRRQAKIEAKNYQREMNKMNSKNGK